MNSFIYTPTNISPTHNTYTLVLLVVVVGLILIVLFLVPFLLSALRFHVLVPLFRRLHLTRLTFLLP